MSVVASVLNEMAGVSKPVAAKVQEIIRNQPELTFMQLSELVDQSYQRDDGSVQFWVDVEQELIGWSGEWKQKVETLKTELDELSSKVGEWLVDENVAIENMDRKFSEGSVGWWKEFYGHLINTAANTAEEAGFNLNELLGRVVY